MAENKFMDLLSDIDERFIKDMTGEKESGQEEEAYQSAEIVNVGEKKRSLPFIRIFSYMAAALLLTAAVSIGAHLIREDLPVNPADTAKTENTVPSQTAEITLPGVSNGVPIAYVAINAVAGTDFEAMQEEIDLSDYPAVNVSQIPNIDDSYERIYEGYGEGNEKMIAKAVLDTKKCGELNLSLIGYGLFTDNRIYPDRVIALCGYMIVLERDGRIVSSQAFSQSASDFLFRDSEIQNDGFMFMLHKDHLNEFTAIEDFGDCQVIMARLIGDDIIAKTQFFGVKNNALYLCAREDLNYSFQAENVSGAYYSSEVQYDEGRRICITDKLLKKEYRFDFSIFDTVYYTVTDGDEIMTDMNSYPFFKETSVLEEAAIVLNGGFEEKANQLIAGGVPKVRLGVKQETAALQDYTLCLVGEYLRIDSESSSNIIKFTCFNPKILVYQNDKYVGTIPLKENALRSTTESDCTELMPKLYVMQGAALIVNKDLNESYYGVGCFYAVKNGALYSSFDGYWPDAADNPPEWTLTAERNDNIFVEEENNSVICGFYRYVFDLSTLETAGIGTYRVLWLEEEYKK